MNQPPDSPPSELSRTQILVAMAMTALLLLVVARLWLFLDSTPLLPVVADLRSLGLGLALALGISFASGVAYRMWPSYRRSADTYMQLILTPLHWGDLLWLGLLPGLSEELLFRGVMLPAIGLNWFGVAISGLSFGVLHASSLQQWPYILWASVVGTALALSAATTGNLMVPLVAHIVTNIAASILWKLQRT